MSRFFNKKGNIINNIGRQTSVQLEIQEVQQQFSTPTIQTNERPDNNEGQDGDKKVVVEGNQEFLYVKVDDRWMKSELQEVEI